MENSGVRALRALSIHRYLLRAGLAGAHLFAWVFIFHYLSLLETDVSHALARTALLYALSHTVTCLVTPLAARLLRKSTRIALCGAIIFAAASFSGLAAAFGGFWESTYLPSVLAAFACGLGTYRALYWVPYEVEAATVGRRRGSLFFECLIALLPLLAGVGIGLMPYGPVSLLFMGAALIALSALPMLWLPSIRETFSWRYRETFGHLIEPANRPIVFPAFLEGIGGAGLLLFWPLAVFLVIGWSYALLGVILSLTFLVSIVARSFIRGSLRRKGLHTSRVLAIVFSVTPWIFRMFVATPLGAIAVDSYFYTTNPRRIGLDPLTSEQSADGGSFIDEYTALKEMSLSLGRIALSAVAALAALTVSLPAAFIIVFL